MTSTLLTSGSPTGEFSALHESLQRYASHIAPAGADAQEIAQDAMGEIWLKLLEGKALEHPERYGKRVVRNRVLNAHRRAKTQEKSAKEIALISTQPPDALTGCIHSEVETMMRQSIHALPKRERLVTLLVCLYGMSRDEIAFILGVRPDTVSDIRGRAVQTLATALRNRECA